MSSKIDLNELHELTTLLEDTGNYKEAQVLHEKFIKESQKVKSSHPYYSKGSTYKILSGDTLTSIARKLKNDGWYAGNVNYIKNEIENVNGKPLGVLQQGSLIKLPKPNSADENAWNEYQEKMKKVPSVKKPNFDSPLFKRVND